MYACWWPSCSVMPRYYTPLGYTARGGGASVTPVAVPAAEATGRELGSGQPAQPAGIPLDLTEALGAGLPLLAEGDDLVVVPPDEVPPHDDGLVVGGATEQHGARGLLGDDRELGEP